MPRNRPPRRLFIVILILAVIVVGIVNGVYFFREAGVLPDKTKAANAGLKNASDQGYLGPESCRSCHGKQYDDWKGSFHDLAMSVAGPESVRGDFNTTFTSQGITSKFYRKDNRFYVNTEGPDGKYHDYEVAYTFGVAPLQQYLVKFPGGRLQCLRTAWDTKENRWFDLYPDYEIAPAEWLHWSRGGLNWNTMCADCHSTHVQKNFDQKKKSFNTTFSLINVSCEACHGPGKSHVEKVSSPTFDNSEYDAQENLYQTSGVPSRQQVDQCARCHSRRVQFTEVYDHHGEYMDHYAPEILRDDLYYPDGQIREEVYEYGSFLQSKMYGKNVKCSDCHDPHNQKLKAEGNNLCGQCHTPAVYNTPDHHFHRAGTESSRCVSCHMPGRYYMGNDFRRDHSLRIPRPDLSVKYNTPNACNQCHTDKTSAWAAGAVVRWYGRDRKFHFSEVLAFGSTRSGEAVGPLAALAGDSSQPAIARATAVWYLDQILAQETVEAIVKSLQSSDHLIRYTAANALADAPADVKVRNLEPLLNDKVRTVRYAAANALADISVDHIGRNFQAGFQRNISEYETSFGVRADFPGGQLEKGIFYERRDRHDQAELAYLEALRMDDHLNAARLNLAYLYNRQGKNDRAIGLLRKIIEQEPAFAMAYYSLGLLYAEENKIQEAIPYLAKAAVLEKNPRIYYNLGIAYQQARLPQNAEKTYLKGLQLDANNPELMYALCVLYIQQKNFAHAKPYAQKLGALNPENPEIREMNAIVNRGLPR